MAVPDVVDVARNVDVRGAGFDAGRGRNRVEVVLHRGLGRRVAQKFGEVGQSADQRLGRREPDPAERRLAHLPGDLHDELPIDRAPFALRGLLQGFGDHDRPHAAGRAAPAREASSCARSSAKGCAPR